MTTRLLALCGSARRESINRRLLDVSATIAREHGAEVTLFELPADALPLYDGDLEEAMGLPSAVMALKAEFLAHDGLLIASPEYNGFFSPLLKNAIDWVSRPVPGTASPFAGKTAALLSASTGTLGGIRGLPHLRLLLSNLGVMVAPGQMALALADKAYGEDGKLLPTQQGMLEKCVDDFVRLTRLTHTSQS